MNKLKFDKGMTLKRAFDIVIALAGLLALFPLLIIIAIVIKILTAGPVIFRQGRVGRFGKPFTIYKFRTMRVNDIGSTVTVQGDPRITPFGKYLRKYKIDELPELWNILKGDMSLVGPRPDVQEYAGRLIGEENKILELRPGLTSPASIKYINEEELLASAPNPQKFYDEVLWPTKVRLNLEYYKTRSFLGDVYLIIQTIIVKRDVRRQNPNKLKSPF